MDQRRNNRQSSDYHGIAEKVFSDDGKTNLVREKRKRRPNEEKNAWRRKTSWEDDDDQIE